MDKPKQSEKDFKGGKDFLKELTQSCFGKVIAKPITAKDITPEMADKIKDKMKEMLLDETVSPQDLAKMIVQFASLLGSGPNWKSVRKDFDDMYIFLKKPENRPKHWQQNQK